MSLGTKISGHATNHTALVGLVPLALNLGATAAALVAALLARPNVCAAFVAVAALTEPWSSTTDERITLALRRVSLDWPARTVVRALAVILTGARLWADTKVVTVFVLAALLIGAMMVASIAVAYVSRMRVPIAASRGLGITVPAPSIQLPRSLDADRLRLLSFGELPILVVPLLGWSTTATLGVGIAALVMTAIVVGWMVAAALATGDRYRGPQMLRRVQAALNALAPECILYSGDGAGSTYQVAQWLSTAERLPFRTVVMLRSLAVFETMPDTKLPVICIPAAVNLMSLRLDSAHAALFTSNVGNNLHLIRLPHLATAFIGHGDSDKSASTSPYARVYDQVWVAGPAGRRRYERAAVGVRDDAIIDVGRPQIDHLRDVFSPTGETPTVLYAPTWEGWNAQQAYSSLTTFGRRLVDAVLSSPHPVRLLVKPHPLTGRRDPSLQRVVSDLRRRLSGTQHRVLAAEEDLFDAMAIADLLVADVSSVITDFVATGRPYVITNPLDLDRETFTDRFPVAVGAPLVGPTDDAAPVIELAVGQHLDEFSTARHALQLDLLGPAAPSAMDRFSYATEQLVAAGRARDAAQSIGFLPGEIDGPPAEDAT